MEIWSWKARSKNAISNHARAKLDSAYIISVPPPEFLNYRSCKIVKNKAFVLLEFLISLIYRVQWMCSRRRTTTRRLVRRSCCWWPSSCCSSSSSDSPSTCPGLHFHPNHLIIKSSIDFTMKSVMVHKKWNGFAITCSTDFQWQWLRDNSFLATGNYKTRR